MTVSHIAARAAPLAGVNISFMILATTVTALRCYVRIRMLNAFGVDDWLMAGATVSFIFYCTFSLLGVANGTGYHVWELAKESNAEARKWWWLCYPSYAVTMSLAKMSIAFFFRRLIVNRVHKWILAAAVTLTLISCLTFFFACIFQCWPVSYFWDKYSQTGTCIPDDVVIALGILFSAINIIADFTFALLPAWLVHGLNMKRKTKVAVSLLMGLGCIASTAVVIRLPYMRFIASSDFLYATVDVAIWSSVEQGLAITAAGLATLQPLFKIIGYKLGLTSSGPSLPDGGGASGYMHNSHSNRGDLELAGAGRGGAERISVKKSFTLDRGQAPVTTASAAISQKAMKQGYDKAVLELQPGVGYEATCMCYNTSQEALRETGSGMEEGPEAGRKVSRDSFV
ncbi:hypothetical protein VTI74DRAFT_10463 [Chaetomium olivicolor]